MKLDSRIIEGKKPLDCFDAENKELMKSFLNKEGYVSNNLENFCLLDGCFKRSLSNVFKKVKDCFKTSINGGDGGDWKYFLPAEWVKEPEKKYRPFSIEEWKFKHSIGETILYRYKRTNCGEYCEAELMYLGYFKPLDGVTDEAGKGELVLGNESLGLQNLFNNYEIWVDGGWKPFGVEED